MPTSTSNRPMRSSRSSSTRRSVSTSECRYCDLDPVLGEVVGEVLGHALGQRGDQDALVALDAGADLVEQVVDLALGGLDDDLRVDQAGGADDLLDHAVGLAQLVLARGRREVHGLPDALEELVPLQRPVVHGRGQPEAVVHQGPLARHVALVHGADLRDGDVGFVDDQQEVVGEVVDAGSAGRCPGRGRRCAGSSSRCRCRTPSAPSFPGRRWCACAAAGPPPACSGSPGSASRCCSSSSMSLMARFIRSAPAT